MSKFVDFLKEQTAFYALKGVDKSEISRAEAKLGLSFAPDYREYLEVFALASFEGHEFTGICKSERLNVVDVTNKSRQIFGEAADGMYVIEEAGIDGIVVFQGGDGGVFCFAPGVAPRKIADSIVDYIKLSAES